MYAKCLYVEISLQGNSIRHLLEKRGAWTFESKFLDSKIRPNVYLADLSITQCNGYF